LTRIGQAVLLSEETALWVLIQRMPKKCISGMRLFREALLKANNIWPETDECATIERFVANLEVSLRRSTERIFLRKVGGGYIFVHRLLMEHFASLYAEQQAALPSDGAASADSSTLA
jgi:hypothetical protein